MTRLTHLTISAVLALPTLAIARAGPPQTVLEAREVQSTGPIRGFELNTPLPLDAGERVFRQCRYQLFNHSFGQYSGHAEATHWSPSLVEECGPPSNWREVELEMTGKSAGRQYDRLGSVWLGGVELWRTDNSEPTPAGVVWSTRKSVSKYYALWAQEGTVAFDYENYLSAVDTAPLNMTLDVIVHVPRQTEGYTGPLPLAQRTAELVLPLSLNRTGNKSMFSVGGSGNPSEGSTSVTLPAHTRAALVEIYASGTAQEEEWYTSVPDDVYPTLSSNVTDALELYPHGPVREVQLRVDGRLAGFVQPFPVIFTGGIAPGMWRPMVAYGAFDQPTYTLDLTAFLPTLLDGRPHNVSLAVVSGEKNGSVDSSWFLSGNIQAKLDPSGKPTTGSIVHYEAEPLPHGSLNVSSNVTGRSSVMSILESQSPRTLRINSLLYTGADAKPQWVTWEQSGTTFANCTVVGSGSLAQMNIVNSTGSSHSSHGGKPFLNYRWGFPLNVSSRGDGRPFRAWVQHGYHTHLAVDDGFGLPAWARVDTMQTTGGEFNLSSIGRLASSVGNASQHFDYADANRNTFQRFTEVWSANSTTSVTQDCVGGSLAAYADTILPPS